MHDKKTYANGQTVQKIEDGILTYFFKTGKVKAFGAYVDDEMRGKWTFYRESKGDGNHLWQIGHFKNNQKHGNWVRYSRDDKVEYDEDFVDGKIIKN